MDRSSASWIFSIVFVFVLISRLENCEAKEKIFNVVEFGAVGDARVDDTQAFTKAWEAACNGALPQGTTPLIRVPIRKIFLVKKLTFQGPCKSPTIHFQIRGRLVAPKSPSDWEGIDYWIMFRDVNGLTMNGIGVFDCRGSEWWKKASDAGARPTALLFSHCNDLVVDGLTSLDSPRNHISVTGCDGAIFSNLRLVAPADSPNTDGIDIGGSKNIQIHHSHIETGDDCIAIGDATSFVNVTSVYCGPGHGISIGSLGKDGATSTVEEIHVTSSTFNGTQNGARIKTWQGGAGYARKITFHNITVINTNQPIIIDEYYCPHNLGCKNETKAVKISEVSFTGFRGTSSSEEAIILNCSKTVGCTNIYVDDVNMKPDTRSTRKTKSTCINAHGKSGSDVSPKVDCLLH